MASESKSIYTDDGIEVACMEKKAESFLLGTTFLFGGQKSGKTTIVEDILYTCKDRIPNYIVIVPETSADLYRRKLPARCIKSDLTKKKLQQIWKRQTDVTQCCNIAKNMDVLRSLFNRVNDRQAILMVQLITRRAKERIELTRRRTDIDPAEKRDQEKAIETLQKEKLLYIYKDTIRNHKQILEHRDLNSNERIALEYLDTNPNFMIVIDDCSEKVSTWMSYFKKGEENIFESILFRGRHNNITMLFVSHDETLIKPRLRQGARNTIFTTSQALVGSLTRGDSVFGGKKQGQKEGISVASKVFSSDGNGVKTFKKFCYVREDAKPYKYIIADLHDDFDLGCMPLKELANKMPKKEDSLEENQFVKSIVASSSKKFKKD